METKKIGRVYRGADAMMVSIARVTHHFFLSEIGLFTAYDTTMTVAYADQFMLAIDAAEVAGADYVIRSQQAQKTEEVAKLMDRARGKYKDVRYFAEKAFANSAATQGEFGFNDYLSIRKDKAKMIVFLDKLYEKCLKYATELTANGMTAAEIAEIDTLKTTLQQSNTSQESFKKERPKTTEERIVILNECFKMMACINKAAQRVYQQDYAKQKQFVYRPRQHRVKKQTQSDEVA
ncbi:MAG: hypothetical protein U0U67_05580 [Chitinophagales bacterium]